MGFSFLFSQLSVPVGHTQRSSTKLKKRYKYGKKPNVQLKILGVVVSIYSWYLKP